MDLKIIEPIKNHLKEFKTVDEFNLYYSKNKEEIDSMTTHKLNKMYFINGYRITKIKGKLCLKNHVEKENDESCELNKMKKEINQLKEVINEIIKYINQNSTEVSPPELT